MSNRSVATDALATLGTIIDDAQKRDAIHLAVIPMVAGRRRLAVGAHVNASGVEVKPYSDTAVGIVDPFLPTSVEPGEHYWLVIYPRIITSLRHVWAHPAFPDETGTPAPPNPDRAAAEAWLREFISKSDCPDFDSVIRIACGESLQLGDDAYDGASHNDGERLHFSGVDAHGDIPPEFWDHLEVYTGRKFEKSDRAEYFSCSC